MTVAQIKASRRKIRQDPRYSLQKSKVEPKGAKAPKKAKGK